MALVEKSTDGEFQSEIAKRWWISSETNLEFLMVISYIFRWEHSILQKSDLKCLKIRWISRFSAIYNENYSVRKSKTGQDVENFLNREVFSIDDRSFSHIFVESNNLSSKRTMYGMNECCVYKTFIHRSCSHFCIFFLLFYRSAECYPSQLPV